MRVAALLLICSILSAQSPVHELYTEAVVSGPLPGLYDNWLYIVDLPNRVRIFSPDGHVAASFDVLDAEQPASAGSIAVDSDGSIAVGWSTWQWKQGVQVRDSSGKLIRGFDTGLFVPAHLAFASDHSLWIFGWERDAGRREYPAQEYLALRHYSAEGKEIGAYLQRSLFPAGMQPGGAQPQERRIFVTPQGIDLVAFSGKDSAHNEWLELDWNGNIRGRCRLDGDPFPHVARTFDGQVYAMQHDSKTHKDFTVRLDRATSSWQVVPQPAEGTLYGADGDQLIYGSWPMHAMILRWYRQPM